MIGRLMLKGDNITLVTLADPAPAAGADAQADAAGAPMTA